MPDSRMLNEADGHAARKTTDVTPTQFKRLQIGAIMHSAAHSGSSATFACGARAIRGTARVLAKAAISEKNKNRSCCALNRDDDGSLTTHPSTLAQAIEYAVPAHMQARNEPTEDEKIAFLVPHFSSILAALLKSEPIKCGTTSLVPFAKPGFGESAFVDTLHLLPKTRDKFLSDDDDAVSIQEPQPSHGMPSTDPLAFLPSANEEVGVVDVDQSASSGGCRTFNLVRLHQAGPTNRPIKPTLLAIPGSAKAALGLHNHATHPSACASGSSTRAHDARDILREYTHPSSDIGGDESDEDSLEADAPDYYLSDDEDAGSGWEIRDVEEELGAGTGMRVREANAWAAMLDGLYGRRRLGFGC